MPRQFKPSLNLEIRTTDGLFLSAKGPCTDSKSFAVYMLYRFYNHAEPCPEDEPRVATFRRAVGRFVKAAARYEAAAQREKDRKAKVPEAPQAAPGETDPGPRHPRRHPQKRR